MRIKIMNVTKKNPRINAKQKIGYKCMINILLKRVSLL